MKSDYMEDLIDEMKRTFENIIQAYEDDLQLDDMYKYKEILTNEYYELIDDLDYIIDEMERNQPETNEYISDLYEEE